MDIPGMLNEALMQLTKETQQSVLQKQAQDISLAYRSQESSGARLVTTGIQATAYAAARMPATYSAVAKALGYALDISSLQPKTMIDAGAGTGAGSWAAAGLLALDDILCLERESAMRRVGEVLMQYGPPSLKSARWMECDLQQNEIGERAELVLAAYVLNEMTTAGRAAAVQKLWKAAKGMLLLVEPGTPAGYMHLMEARKQLKILGAYVAAPCPHDEACPLTQGDWCHFSCRVSRSRIHKHLKGGEAAYEDEKFAYMAFVHEKLAVSISRILRHPQIRKGHVMLSLCTFNGIHNLTVSKRETEAYKWARDASAGDIFG